ncbi:MAG TPA: SIR2 family protein [Rhizomicrobium sp.]|nr:SIR2 family protein [Rhizomicrobium sp.]
MANVASETRYLFSQIKKGEAFLLLGAGSSVTCDSANRTRLKSGLELAKKIATDAGFEYQGETLAEVVQATVGHRLSQVQFHQLLQREYLKCVPSQELRKLFSYTWVRAYTLNIDDTVERIGRPYSGQKVSIFNARVDKVSPKDETGLADLHLVHLNGEALKPDHGLIFSKDDYALALSEEQPWYAELAADYQKYTPVIIGSSLNEPILDVELERIKKREGRSGAAFLVTPAQFTDIQSAILHEKNIFHLQMSLAEFANLLQSQIGAAANVETITAATRPEFDPKVVATLSHDDIKTAMAVKPVALQNIRVGLTQMSKEEVERRAKNFLQGGPPTWPIVMSDIPVRLHEGKGFGGTLAHAISEGYKLVVVTGTAGSGKSTLAMQCLCEALTSDSSAVLYELGSEAPSYSRVFDLLQRLHPSRRIFLFVNDLFLYGDQLHFDLETIRENNIIVVTTARLGEWKERFEKYFRSVSLRFELQRFVAEDYGPLTERILKYVPAPNFAKASPAERLKRFQNSRRQLLIALREITESRKFDDVIDDEYNKLPDLATRFLFRLVGVATLARVGVDEALAAQIYNAQGFTRSFGDARSALEGVVLRNSDRRLQVRHELYVEHIFRKVEPLSAFLEALNSLLTMLSRYKVPLLSSLSRADAQLFKFLLNHRTLLRRCRAAGEQTMGLAVYEKFEKAFELDGHFWLQYGLYCRSLGRLSDALRFMSKSIDAFPENPAAIHAVADLKLRLAADPSVSDAIAHRYIEEAVPQLLRLDAKQDGRTDLYPIVTLADRHIHALLMRKQPERAREVARRYFPRIQEHERAFGAHILRQLMTNVMKFVTNGIWTQTDYRRFTDQD